MTYYHTLGVHAQSTPGEIDAAARKLSREYHPDRGGDADKMAAINKARHVLRDPELARKYRAVLKATTYAVCPQCAHFGGDWHQRGFQKRVFVPCAKCDGVGLVLR